MISFHATNDRLWSICLWFCLFMLKHEAVAQDYRTLREKMVNEQIAGRGIKSKQVLAAMRKVERHRFIPANTIAQAYEDTALPIGEGQTISQPYVVAFMTEVLDLGPTDKVLEIGTGSGYQAAILAEICKEVYSIEIVASLGQRSKELLQVLNYKNVFVHIGDGYLGWQEAAPFDAIIVTCSPSQIPAPLQDQLKEGGRMVIPVGGTYLQDLVLIVKKEGKLKKIKKLPVQFVPMLDKSGKRY
jgi:protein-L-isoaspartate(D-aspartate) O-methyltransferase